MEGKVEIKDYEQKQHLLLITLNLVGINIDYITVDLINSALEKLAEKDGNMDIRDAATIKALHEAKWNEYFDSKDKK